MTNNTRHLQYVMIRLHQQGTDDLESSEEVDVYQPSPSHPSLLSLCVNTSPSLVPHMDRVVSSEVIRFSLKAMLWMNISTYGRFGTWIVSLGTWESPPKPIHSIYIFWRWITSPETWGGPSSYRTCKRPGIIHTQRFQILIIAVMDYTSLGFTLHLLRQFSAESTTQGEEVKGASNIGKQAQYLTDDHPTDARFSRLFHCL